MDTFRGVVDLAHGHLPHGGRRARGPPPAGRRRGGRPEPGEIALLAYTSGTTGVAKGALLPHRAIIANGTARAVADAFTWRDRVLIILPMAFTGGASSYLRESLVTGATAIVGAAFDPPRVLELLERERITICSAVPVIWETLLTLPQLGQADLSALRACIGVLDEDGYLKIVDRARDMLISGGLNVYPAEIEAAIAGLPGLEECAVIGVPDDRWGEPAWRTTAARDGSPASAPRCPGPWAARSSSARSGRTSRPGRPH